MAELAIGASWKFIHGIPRVAVAPDLARPEKPERVLVYGELPIPIALALEERGTIVERARTSKDALIALAASDYMSVAIDPTAEAAIELVKMIKIPSAKLSAASENVWRAASRHRATPFVILPLPNDTEYAVILTAPNGAFLERSLPIVTALTELDFRRWKPGQEPRN
jgi:hypothetical protein